MGRASTVSGWVLALQLVEVVVVGLLLPSLPLLLPLPPLLTAPPPPPPPTPPPPPHTHNLPDPPLFLEVTMPSLTPLSCTDFHLPCGRGVPLRRPAHPHLHPPVQRHHQRPHKWPAAAHLCARWVGRWVAAGHGCVAWRPRNINTSRLRWGVSSAGRLTEAGVGSSRIALAAAPPHSVLWALFLILAIRISDPPATASLPAPLPSCSLC